MVPLGEGGNNTILMHEYSKEIYTLFECLIAHVKLSPLWEVKVLLLTLVKW